MSEDKKAPKIPKDPGRPSKLTQNKASKMVELAKQGKTDVQIADILNVSEGTIYNWQKRNEELLLAYREAKHQANEMVEGSLFQRAMGYEHKAVKVFFDSKSLQTVEHEYIEKFPPDVGAATFWLKNRDPERWKDKTEVKTDVSITPTESPEAQLERLKSMLKDTNETPDSTK